MKSKAFTLIELVMILVIIAIISTGGYVAISRAKQTVTVDSAAKKIAADLAYVQNLALSQAKWYGVSFEITPGNLYTVYQTDGSTDTIIQNPAQLGSGFVVNLGSIFGGISIQAVNFSGGQKLEFSPLGIPYDDKDGSALAATGEVTLTFSGSNKIVLVQPSTGRIIVQ